MFKMMYLNLSLVTPEWRCNE